MATTDRCKTCDLPLATESDYDTIPGGEGTNLCWSPWNAGGVCYRPAVDWRARALKAEAELVALREERP